MKFKVINLDKPTQPDVIFLQPHSAESCKVPGDQVEFSKQVYQTIQQYLLSQEKQWCVEVLR